MNISDINYRRKNDALRLKLSVSRLYGIVMTIFCCVLCFIYINNNNKLVNEVNTKEQMIVNIKDNYKYLEEETLSLSNTIIELTLISQELDEQNKQLVETNEKYYAELSEFRNRSELYDKYEYALVDNAGNRTDITYDNLVTLKDLVENSNVPDEDLILAIIMTESGGKEKAKSTISTAKGFGQILDGTSKFIYCDLMGNPASDWSPKLALDGDTNIEMMVEYVDYLIEKNDGDLYKVIENYRGLYDKKYFVKIDYFLANSNKSIASISPISYKK